MLNQIVRAQNFAEAVQNLVVEVVKSDPDLLETGSRSFHHSHRLACLASLLWENQVDS